VGFQLTFDDWQDQPPPAIHNTCSPNLLAVLAELQRRWPFAFNDGCFGSRPIRGSSTVVSSHSYGAAIDVGYHAADDEIVRDQVVGFLVGRSLELHIDALHDYRRCRIWRAGRTPDVSDACVGWWKAQRPSGVTGMGQVWANHLHLETTVAGWGDASPAGDRWTE
jgi:hypothetical protein